jgi:hypothetical protein
MSAFSSATVEIHSPPDFTRSFARSCTSTKPSGWIDTTSPVLNQPSSVQRSAPSSDSKYAEEIDGPRTSSSPIA